MAAAKGGTEGLVAVLAQDLGFDVAGDHFGGPVEVENPAVLTMADMDVLIRS